LRAAGGNRPGRFFRRRSAERLGTGKLALQSRQRGRGRSGDGPGRVFRWGCRDRRGGGRQRGLRSAAGVPAESGSVALRGVGRFAARGRKRGGRLPTPRRWATRESAGRLTGKAGVGGYRGEDRKRVDRPHGLPGQGRIRNGAEEHRGRFESGVRRERPGERPGGRLGLNLVPRIPRPARRNRSALVPGESDALARHRNRGRSKRRRLGRTRSSGEGSDGGIGAFHGFDVQPRHVRHGRWLGCSLGRHRRWRAGWRGCPGD
jgi:hypothetical protein